MSHYALAIRQRDKPHHAVIAELHDRVPTPSQGGGGWEEVAMPRRRAVLIWRGLGLLKLALSVVFDRYDEGESVMDDTFNTLLHFWRPEPAGAHPPPEPSILKLSGPHDAVPYQNLAWVISNLEWAEAQGDDAGHRLQQVLVLEFTEFRADERLKTASQTKGRTRRYKVRPGDTLAKLAKAHGISAKALGAMQKPPIKDPRHLKVGQVIIVPVARAHH